MLKSALIVTLLLGGGMASAWPLKGTNLLTGTDESIASGTKGVVAVFMSVHCPCSNSHVGVLKALKNKYKEFQFVAIHSNADEPAESSKPYFEKASLGFPVLQDVKHALADELKASRTPHAFVLSTTGQVLYRGGVTDSTEAERAQKQYLEQALKDVRDAPAGVPLDRVVKTKETRSLGCAIMR